MAENHTILQELKELESSLVQITSSPAYRVPAGYFEGLAAEILLRAKALDASTAQEELAVLSPLLSQLSGKNPYTVPTGYFEELNPLFAVNIDQSATEEISSISPLLSGLKKEMPYSVPAGYFQQLETAVDKKSSRTEARVVPMAQRKWFRIAAAAVIVTFVATSALFYINRPSNVDPDTKSYAWVEKNMKKVSTEDINEFVDIAKEDLAVQVDAGSDLKTLLNDVSDKEIQEFLNDTGSTESDTEDDLFLN